MGEERRGDELAPFCTTGLLAPQLFLLNFSPYQNLMHEVELPVLMLGAALLVLCCWEKKTSEFQVLGEVDREELALKVLPPIPLS